MKCVSVKEENEIFLEKAYTCPLNIFHTSQGPFSAMSFRNTLVKLLSRHGEISEKLMQPDIPTAEYAKLSKEFSDLTPVVEGISNLFASETQTKELDDMLKDPSLDREFKDLAEMELQQLKNDLPKILTMIKTPFLKYAPEQGGRKQHFSQVRFFECINVMRKSRDGALRF
jgi:hypothetical protein